MMPDSTAKLLAEALRLPIQERARLAAELIASVDGEPDADAEAAWAAEITRRAERARAGTSKGNDWEIVRQRLKDSIQPK
jgi:putative addiction module component (TIGR02574 family)